MEKISKEYREFLQGLNKISLEEFLNQIKTFKDGDGSYFKEIEQYLKENIAEELLKLFEDKKFIKLFSLPPQAEYLKTNLNLKQDLDILKTLIYCYNTNKRDFEKERAEQKLKTELLKRGFKEQDILNKEELKKLSGLKVVCVFDRCKINFMGSYTEKGEYAGKLFFDEQQNSLFFMPKRHTRTGQILINKFYYKEI